jgi:hypothetical protein
MAERDCVRVWIREAEREEVGKAGRGGGRVVMILFFVGYEI